MAFSRDEPAAVVTVVDRRGTDPTGGWGGTTVGLPPGRWRERLDGGGVLEGEIAAGDLVGGFPGALLVRA